MFTNKKQNQIPGIVNIVLSVLQKSKVNLFLYLEIQMDYCIVYENWIY